MKVSITSAAKVSKRGAITRRDLETHKRRKDGKWLGHVAWGPRTWHRRRHRMGVGVEAVAANSAKRGQPLLEKASVERTDERLRIIPGVR